MLLLRVLEVAFAESGDKDPDIMYFQPCSPANANVQARSKVEQFEVHAVPWHCDHLYR
jgi:hypothetical protein